MRTTIYIFLCAASPLLAHEPEAHSPFELAHAHESVTGHIHAGWESRYFSQGRDSLGGDSLAVASAEVAWKHWSLGLWHGFSPEQNYDETKLTLAVTEQFGDLECYVGFTHLWFAFAGLEDNEIGAGVSWSGLPWKLSVAADAAYSTEAKGTFVEVSLNREFEVSEKFSVTGSGIFGVNQGFVADGHDGANHCALRVGAKYALTESLALAGHAAYSWALERDPHVSGDERLVDFFHASIGMEWSF